jgi:exonuclease VII large subunit
MKQIENLYKNLPDKLETIRTNLKMFEQNIIVNKFKEIDSYSSDINCLGRLWLQGYEQKLDTVGVSLIRGGSFGEKYETRLKIVQDKLGILSPLSTLQRGFSIVKDENGKVIKNSDQVEIGKEVRVQLAKGSLLSKVTKRE